MTELTPPPLQSRYPKHLINCWRLADGRTTTVRPIRHDDGALEQDFVRSCRRGPAITASSARYASCRRSC